MDEKFEQLLESAIADATPPVMRHRGMAPAVHDALRMADLACPVEQRRRSAPWCLRMLGLSDIATPEELRRAFRRRAREVHPDTGGSHEDFLLLQRALREAESLCASARRSRRGF